ncbi:MAG: FtsQ-type POTRA domain-containing protein [Betaproteobacteria bacterium]|nr:FtsQ-type POTRA domain-containing protein [Betaproteobacteria bacterium]
MWDRPDALNAWANFLFGLAAVIALYAIVFTIVRLPYFPVREVRVVGTISHVTPAQIEAVVHRELRGNFFTINLDRSRAAFEKLPWVRKVQVRRLWPDRLEIALDEHVALARWGDEGLVDTYGELFTAASDDQLPVFEGPKELVHEIAGNFVRFRDELRPLDKHISAIRVSDRRAWTLVLDEGMTLEVGREHLDERVEKFVSAYGASVALMHEVPRIVDLRYPNGFAVRLRNGQDGV